MFSDLKLVDHLEDDADDEEGDDHEEDENLLLFGGLQDPRGLRPPSNRPPQPELEVDVQVEVDVSKGWNDSDDKQLNNSQDYRILAEAG